MSGMEVARPRVGLLGLAVWLATSAFPLSAQEDLPAGKGKEILENTCTECHGLDRVLSRLRTERQWRSVAVQMRAKGATMSDDELKTLVEYLSQNFGAVEVDMNKASAKEIETVLELRPAEARAIVRYREANGPFREWRDVAKVNGVDKAKIEAVKDRMTF